MAAVAVVVVRVVVTSPTRICMTGARAVPPTASCLSGTGRSQSSPRKPNQRVNSLRTLMRRQSWGFLRVRARLACLVIPSPSAHPPGSGPGPAGHGGAPCWTNDRDPRGLALLGFAWVDGVGMTRQPTPTTLGLDGFEASIPEPEVPAGGIGVCTVMRLCKYLVARTLPLDETALYGRLYLLRINDDLLE